MAYQQFVTDGIRCDATLNIDKNELALKVDVSQGSSVAYAVVLDFIFELLAKNKELELCIHFNLAEKHFLDVDGVAQTDTNAFFATCAKYPELHAKLESYVRQVMKGFKHYKDTDDVETMMHRIILRHVIWCMSS